MEETMTTFGDNVRKYRMEKGMTQEELALKLGYKGRSSINKIETNVAQVPQKTIQELANALGVEVARLFSDAEPQIRGTVSQKAMEFVPYIERAEDWQLDAIRKILDMPTKKICKSENKAI